MTYGTRASSASLSSGTPATTDVGALPVPIPHPPKSHTSISASPLNGYTGKKRASSTTKRVTNSTAGIKSPSGIALSLPANTSHMTAGNLSRSKVLSTTASASAGLGLVGVPLPEDEDDGEVKPSSKKDHGQLYECEKCSKVYRHQTCLIKHRWEHTAHWKEASKLLLSKHQQVQLLEAAAILKAASTGTSLPEEKSLWPAAVSPPTSGLLGSPVLNIHALASPRAPPQSMSLQSDNLFDDEEEIPQDDEDDMEGAEETSTGDEQLAEGMFEMEIDEERKPAEEERDSGYGSLNSHTERGPVLGFFETRAGAVV